MTALTYTSGDITKLVDGGPASMNDIAGPLTDFRTYINTQSLDSDNFTGSAFITDALRESPNNANWRTICSVQGNNSSTGTMGGGTHHYISSNNNSAVVDTVSTTGLEHWLPPTSTDIDVAGKTTNFRMRITHLCNATAPGTSIVYGLYPIATLGGGAGLMAGVVGTALLQTTFTPTTNTSSATSSTIAYSAITGGLTYAFGVKATNLTAAAYTGTWQYHLEISHS